MKKKYLLPLLCACFCIFLQAQAQITVSGKVTDQEAQALPGVNVTVKGTVTGTVTDSQGMYRLTAPSREAILVFSFVGYTSEEMTIGDRSVIDLVLQPDLQALSEVVVVGYSDKKRSEITSAVDVVSSSKLKDVTTNNVGQMLQGKVAGLQVVNSSGVPGAAAEIRLRGVSSINGNQNPLYVVDGVIGGNFDPNDVENITILKDAGSTAMYGSQANAGVIIVTTKKARDGKTRFEAKITTGFRTPDFGNLDMMNGNELYDRHREFYRDYDPLNPTNSSYKVDVLRLYQERPLSLRNQDYNWLNTVFDKAPMQNFYLSAAGKTAKNDYYIGVSYYTEQGTFTNTNYQRLNLRANTTYHFSDKISLTNNINLSGVQGKSYNFTDVFNTFLLMPWDNPFDSTGAPQYVDGTSPFKWWSRDKVNPLHTITNSDYPYRTFDANYDMVFNVAITRWLTFTTSNRVALGVNRSTFFISPVVAGDTRSNGGVLTETSALNYGGISNNLLKFNFDFGNHNLSGLAGAIFEGGRTEDLTASGNGLPEGLRVLNVISKNQTVGGTFNTNAIHSFLAQVNYNFADKYFLTGSYRVDRSSNFPPANRTAGFPSVGAAWLVSSEDFMQNARFVNNLKLRVSYGVTGNQSIGAGRYLGLFSLNTQYNTAPGAIPVQLPSPNLTWESKQQLNAGLDLSLFRRVNLTVDYYRNVTTDLLLQVPQAISTGFESRWDNTGKITNQGIELAISAVAVQSGGFEWTPDFNISFNKNTISDLPSPIFFNATTWSISQIYRNGGNLYEFYLPKWLGVDKQTGAPLWEEVVTDEAGNVTSRQPTTDYTKATRQEVGSALPKFQGGFNNTFSYKGVTLRVNTYFLSGNKVFSNILRFVNNDGHEPYYNQSNLPDGASYWTKPGDDATEPSPQNAALSTETSSRFLKDGSYLTIRNVMLAYELPKAWVSKIRFEGVTVSLTADNVYTFSKFFGQDPQTTLTQTQYTLPGTSDFKYPNNRQFLLNLNFRF